MSISKTLQKSLRLKSLEILPPTTYQVRSGTVSHVYTSEEYVGTSSGGHALSGWVRHTTEPGWSGRQVYAQRGTSGRDRVVLGDAPEPVNPAFHPWSIIHPCDACTDNNNTVQLYTSTSRGSTRPQQGTLALETQYGVQRTQYGVQSCPAVPCVASNITSCIRCVR